MTTMTPSSSRYQHIDALRATAVMLVVAAHAGLGDVIPGGSGVTIFFSISGFIITYLLLRERDRTGGFSAGGFYLRRVLKIGPPLLVIVFIPTIVYSFSNTINWAAFCGQLFFYFNWFKIHGDANVLPGSGVVWSLSIEEQFYVVFALIWIGLIRIRASDKFLGYVACSVVIISTLIRIILATESSANASRIYYGSDTRIDGIAWGVLVAVVYHSWSKQVEKISTAERFTQKDWVPVLAVLLFSLSLLVRDQWFRDTFRFTFQSLATCLIILYGFGSGQSLVRRGFNAVVRLKIVQRIGLASYSIYLVHLSLIVAIDALVGDLPRAIMIGIGILGGTAIGYLTYLIVEVPFERLRGRLHMTKGSRHTTINQHAV
jgi:peptidoglycan/LPS O-acetylase OafA/YrhL